MTLAEIDERIPKFKNKGLLVDANLLLVYLLGELDPREIPKFKRTSGFSASEFLLVKAIVDFFPTVITTPGVLTEVSNLAGQLTGQRRREFYSRFADRIQTLKEDHIPSRETARSELFSKLGLTDAAIILVCKDKYLAFTADLLLARFMETNRLDVINFNDIRFLDWN